MEDNENLHFVLLPHLSYGHIIPMVDMGRLFARQGVTVTIFTTPLNATKFNSTIDRDVESGLRIGIVQAHLPTREARLPDGCESMDMLPSRDLLKNLLLAMSMLQQPFESFLVKSKPYVSCIIADKNHSWIADTSKKFGIPWISFDGTSCFSLLCRNKIISSKVIDNVMHDSQHFDVPGMPNHVSLTKCHLPDVVVDPSRRSIIEAEELAYGIVVNSFEELEGIYFRELRLAKNDKVWCIGPVSLCNKKKLDKVERGDKCTIGRNECLDWLDSQEARSVVYICLGSQSRPTLAQLIEVGLGLELANTPFIWVVRGERFLHETGFKSNTLVEFEKWLLSEKFESKTKGRGFIIRGWAPQVLILSHRAIGGFLTHCGWNSTLESICGGVPMITWPLFAEQFINEKLIVEVLKIGVSIGAKLAVKWGEEMKYGALIKKEDVRKAVNELMNDTSKEAEERRNRVKELGTMAKLSIEEEGSSCLYMKSLIDHIKECKHSKLTI